MAPSHHALAASGATLARAAAHASTRAPVAGLRSVLLLLALLTAFLGQDILVQGHVHPLGAETAIQIVNGHGAAAFEQRHPGKAPADCPICAERAMAGHYLTPTPLVLPEPLQTTAWFFVAIAAAFALRASPHGWRSRAPPF